MSRRKRHKSRQSSTDRQSRSESHVKGSRSAHPRRRRWVGLFGLIILLVIITGYVTLFHFSTENKNQWDIPNPITFDTEPAIRDMLQRAYNDVVRTPMNAGTWGAMGAVCHAHLFYECAETCYRKTLSLNSDDFRYTYLLARILDRKEQNTDEVLTLYQKASLLDPAYELVPYRQGETLARKGQLKSARDAYLRALAMKDDFAAAHRGLGQVYISLRDHDKAITHLERAADLFPEDGMIYSSLARAYMTAGERNKANRALEKSKSLKYLQLIVDPVSDEIKSLSVSSTLCYNRAKHNVTEGRYDAALRDLLIVERARPNDPYVQVYLGFSYHQKGSLELARKHLFRALDINPDLVSAYMELGQMLENEDRYDEAISHYRRARQVKPDHAKVNKRLAAALVHNAEYAEAVATFERVSDQRLLDADAHMQWGNALRHTGMYENALEHLRKAVRLNPQMADVYYHLGIVFEELGYQDDADANFQRAVQIDPDHRANQKLP